MDLYNFNSVEIIPDLKAAAAFTVNSSEVFKESEDISPVLIDKDLSYMPWGADNDLPYRVLDLIESDETLSTCQLFNAEVCYGSGLVYDTTAAKKKVQEQVDDFLMDNDLPSYFLGVCHTPTGGRWCRRLTSRRLNSSIFMRPGLTFRNA